MIEKLITSFEELENEVNHLKHRQWSTGPGYGFTYFRGQSRSHYQLVNGIGRINATSDVIQDYELCIWNRYLYSTRSGKLKAVQNPFEAPGEIRKDWFYYIQAQHFRLPTRLMDWSRRWEVALMFCVEDKSAWDDDGQLFAFYCPRRYIINQPQMERLNSEKPLEAEGTYMINAPSYQVLTGIDNIAEKRRLRQHGIMFYQSFENSMIPMEDNQEFSSHLIKFIVPSSTKEAIHKELNRINTNWAYYKEDLAVNSCIQQIKDDCAVLVSSKI